MPPKFKFTREEMVKAAVHIVRIAGMEGLTARSLAAQLGSSPKPIFGLFQNMEEVQAEVIRYADDLYQSYLEASMAEGKYPPYKASGIGYILFAKEEPELFKLLFMRDRTGEVLEENREAFRPSLDMVMNNLGLTEDQAFLFHLEQWVYVHGIATMIATGYLNWDMDFISRTLTDVYQGLRHRHGEGA